MTTGGINFPSHFWNLLSQYSQSTIITSASLPTSPDLSSSILTFLSSFPVTCHFSWFFQHFCFVVVVSQPFSYQWALLEEVGEVTRGFLRLSINGQNLCQHYLYNIYQHLGSKLFFNVLAISYIFSVFNFNWFFYLAFIGDKTDISVELTRVTRGWEEIMLLKKPPTLDTSGSTVITLPTSFLHHSNEIKFN